MNVTNKFLSFGIDEKRVNILKQNGITEPTPIQEQGIPVLLAGKDIVAQAQTGTGKTLAFMLPILERIDSNKSFVQALIITPTRELALQITHEARKYSEGTNLNILAAYGGQDVERQIKKLKETVHIVIGTPGRLLDHVKRKTVNVAKVSMLVLDEADQMLDMGFLKDVEQIIHHIHHQRQTMLLSATIPKGIRLLISKFLKNPEHIRIQSKTVTLDNIKQLVIETSENTKQKALVAAIDQYKPFMAMIFCRTKRRVSALNEELRRRGYHSDELHGDMSQGKREKVMKIFRDANLPILVATDVAARGLDIEGVTHVFNYDIPQDAEDYIHRIGRTGRAGQTGIAITFVIPQERETLMLIEKGIKSTIERHKITIKEDLRVSDGTVTSREHKTRGFDRKKKPVGGRVSWSKSKRAGSRKSQDNNSTEGFKSFRGNSKVAKNRNVKKNSAGSRFSNDSGKKKT